MSKITFEKDFSRHPLHYFTLLCLQLIGLWGILWFNYHPQTQLVIAGYMALAYIIWGVVHHHEHKDLHIKIVFEYILIAILGLLIFGSIVLRI